MLSLSSYVPGPAIVPSCRQRPPVRPQTRPIVVVEDDEDIRDVYKEILEDEGYSVVTANNGREALEALDRLGDRPCLVLLDLMMPVMDGWQFLRVLRKSDRLPALRVIVVSAVPSNTEGAVMVIRKPMAVDDLLNAVKRYCPN